MCVPGFCDLQQTSELDLVAARVATTTSTLVLAASLGATTDVGSSVLTMDTTEVAESLTGTTGTLDKEGLGASRALKSELIESQATATSLGDAGASGLGEAEGSNGDLGGAQLTAKKKKG